MRSWLAEVVTLASGSLSAGGVAAPVEDRRHSAASLLAVLAEQAGRTLGTPFRWDVDANRRVTLSRVGNFDLVHTGDVSTVLGLSGSYTGASSYTGAVAAPGVTLPSGVRLSGPLWSSEGGSPAEGSGAAYGATRAGVTGDVLLDVSWSQSWLLELALRSHTLDVVHAGRWVGRGRVTGVTRARQGRRADLVTLSLTVQGVR